MKSFRQISFGKNMALCLLVLFTPFISFAHDSLLDFENYIKDSYPQGDCVTRNLVISDVTAINSNGSPQFGEPLPIIPANNTKSWYRQLKLRLENYSAAALAGASQGVSSSKFDFSTDADIQLMESACRSAFVFKPDEYISAQQGALSCSRDSNDQIVNTNTTITDKEVPYYYHCDPYFNPASDSSMPIGSESTLTLIGRTQGYVGANSTKCQGANAKLSAKELVGKIVVGYYPEPSLLNAKSSGSYNPCQINDYQTVVIKPGDNPIKLGSLEVVAYHDDNTVDKTKQICAATVNTKYPIKIGCTSYSPVVIAPEQLNIMKSTSCYYLNHERTDLHAIGDMLITSNGENDEGGNFSLSTIKFLKSNIHPLSNITSCIKDVISWVLIGPPDVDTTRLPFFSLLQSKLKGIILATLTLYIAMLGIHIMLHYNEMSTGKMIMFALKFALVYYFTLGDIWSTLFPTIINISNELMSIFSLSELSNDVARYCSYSYQGQEILSERTLPAIGSVSTLGQGGSIRLTFWDYLDCKLINYINLGTCVYEPFTMFATIIGCLISNIILFIVMYLYLVMTFQLVVSMIEVSILSLFTICILILISPIFILFALFNATKDIFDQWLKAFLGYLLYPPLITIFFVLIIFSLDALYYGDIKSKTPFRDQSGAPLYATSLGPVEDESLTPCYGVDSPFCVTAKFYEGGYVKDGAKYSMNLCKLDDLSQIWERSYYTNKPIFSAGPLGKAKKAFTEHFFSAFGKMCIWSFIFWHFFAILVDLSAQILGILPFTSITDKKGLLLNQKKGKGDILNATWKAGAWVASLPFKRSKS